MEPTMTEGQLLEIILHACRGVSLLHLQQAIRTAERAQSVGPIFHPSAWTKEADRMHALNLDILRRFEDLRRALAEADEVQEVINRTPTTTQ